MLLSHVFNSAALRSQLLRVYLFSCGSFNANRSKRACESLVVFLSNRVDGKFHAPGGVVLVINNALSTRGFQNNVAFLRQSVEIIIDKQRADAVIRFVRHQIFHDAPALR